MRTSARTTFLSLRTFMSDVWKLQHEKKHEILVIFGWKFRVIYVFLKNFLWYGKITGLLLLLFEFSQEFNIILIILCLDIQRVALELASWSNLSLFSQFYSVYQVINTYFSLSTYHKECTGLFRNKYLLFFEIFLGFLPVVLLLNC